MPEKSAGIGSDGPRDAQGNSRGGAGSAKAADQKVQVKAMVPSLSVEHHASTCRMRRRGKVV